MRGSVSKLLRKVSAAMKFDSKADKQQKILWQRLPHTKRHAARMKLEAVVLK